MIKKSKILFAALAFTMVEAGYANNSVADVPILWTAVFSEIQPTSNAKVTQDYCIQHSPTTLVTTYQQINSANGVTALNGVNVHYLSYTTQNKNDLYFYIVHGELSGNLNHHKWHAPITLYEQTLTGNSVIWTTWSTPDCKGIFIANPTFPDKQQQANLPGLFNSLATLRQSAS